MSLPKSNGQVLLITGINGYIASVLGHLLLTKGYSIRGTARTAASTQGLVDWAFGEFKERVEIVEVPDMTVPGAFDKAVKGVDGIFHIASPIDMSIATYEGMVETAVAGNQILLNSALEKAGPQLQAVITTSSMAAINEPPQPPGTILTENVFATRALDKAKSDKAAGIQTHPHVLYFASKVAAERALWEFRETKTPKFSISAINPTITFGPPVILPSSPSKLNVTLKPVWALFSGEAKTVPEPVLGVGAFVDVRDVAQAHLWAYENHEAADGERYITAAGLGPAQAMADILREGYPDRHDVIPLGKPGKGYDGYGKGYVGYLPEHVQACGEKAERVMGFNYIDFKTSVLDTAKTFEKFL